MTFLKRLLPFKGSEPPKRTRICIECGMPIEAHKEWCSILRTLRAMEQRQAAAAANQG